MLGTHKRDLGRPLWWEHTKETESHKSNDNHTQQRPNQITRPHDTQKRPMNTQKRPNNTQKRPNNTQKRRNNTLMKDNNGPHFVQTSDVVCYYCVFPGLLCVFLTPNTLITDNNGPRFVKMSCSDKILRWNVCGLQVCGCCIVLQCVAVCCSAVKMSCSDEILRWNVCGLQVCGCCSVLQCVAVCCILLHCSQNGVQ